MTKAEFLKSKEYTECMEKIKNYPKGFTFSLKYGQIPKAKGNALRIITEDCIKQGILETVSFGLNIHGECVEEEYKRL